MRNQLWRYQQSIFPFMLGIVFGWWCTTLTEMFIVGLMIGVLVMVLIGVVCVFISPQRWIILMNMGLGTGLIIGVIDGISHGHPLGQLVMVLTTMALTSGMLFFNKETTLTHH